MLWPHVSEMSTKNITSDFKWAKAVIDYISMVFRYSRFRSKTPGESIH